VLIDQLRRLDFWVLEPLALVVAALTLFQVPALLRALRPSARDLRAVGAASLVAIVLAAGVAPRSNRIFYDEQIYQGIGQNLADLKLAQMCNDGTVEYGRIQCWRPEYNKEPTGYPYLLSVGYRLAGVHEWVAFAINNLTAAVMVWVVFAATALLFDVRAGVWAAIVAALIPEQLMWANSAAAEPTTALACAAAMMAALLFLRTRTTAALAWTVALVVLTANFRPESILIVPLVAAVIVINAPDELRRPRLWWIAAGALAFGAALIAHHVAFRNHRWDAPGAPMSMTYFLPNLASNGWFYLWDERFPAIYTALAVAALVLVGGRRVLVPVAWFLTFWSVFLFFYAGSYNWGQNVRYSLATYAPLAILAGAGASAIVARLERNARVGPIASAAAVALLVVQFLWYLPLVRAIGEEAWAARGDVAFAREMAKALPPHAIVLTHNPHMFHIWGVNAAQMSLATTDEPYVRNHLFTRYSGGVYLHWNFWCNIPDPLQQGFCTTALARFASTPVAERREWTYRFAFYKLTP